MKNHETTFSQQDYELIGTDILYQGFFRLARYHVRHRLFAGGWSEVFHREILERWPAAGVLPYDPLLDRVILIEQFRPGCLEQATTTPWMIEIPAGLLTSPTETPEELVYREAMEEAGCKLTAIEPISKYFVSPGASTEHITLYCGRVSAAALTGIYGLEDEHEDIRVLNLTRTEAFAKLQEGEIKTAPAIIALLWLQMNHDSLLRKWG